MGRRNTGLRRSLAIIIALVMVLTSGVAPLTQFAGVAYAASQDENNPTEVKDWAGLREAVKDGGYIKITQDLVAEGSSIDITKDVHIVGDNATIWRKDGDANFPVFNVKDGGKLELGKGLTLTGLTGTCTGGESVPGENVFKVIWDNGVSGDGHKATEPEVVAAGTKLSKKPDDSWKPGDGYYFTGWRVQYGEKYTNPDDGQEYENWNYNYTDKEGSTNFVVPSGVSGTLTLVAMWAKDEVTPGDGGGWSIYDGNPNYLSRITNGETFGIALTGTDANGKKGIWVMPNDSSNIVELQLITDVDQMWNNYNANKGKWIVKRISSTNHDYTSASGNHPIEYRNAAYYGNTGSINGQYVFVPGWGRGGTDTSKYYGGKLDSNGNVDGWSQAGYWYSEEPVNPRGKEMGAAYFSSWTDVYNWATGATSGGTTNTVKYNEKGYADPASWWKKDETPTTTGEQTCDGDGGCKEYTTSDFASGTGDKYRGFFIEVAANSSATLNGATLENFVTKANSVVKFASPVVAQGENARFDIKDGTIKCNNVGYTAVNSKSQESADKIKSYIENTLELSDTAGAVTYRAGAKGDITGGTITTNRADAGAIAVRGANTEVYMTDGTITKNVGVHYGGAAYVYNGGFLSMGGGTMSNNYAWNKGGAVYVSDEEYGSTKWMQPNSTKKVGKSLFSFDGGTLTGNFAVNRGGAIYVESDGVALLSGNITNNYSRSLGGAVYVAGDGIQRMYQLYVSNGCITGNTAVKSAPELNKYLAGETLQCNIKNNWMGDKSLAGDNKDYAGYAGYGGGLWLCAFGGNATFGYDLDQPDKIVIIDGNTAETQGDDIKLRPTRPGEGSGINIVGNIDADNNKWINENTKKPIEPNTTYSGPLPIRNDRDKEGCDSALTISGNIARVGGAIAANGTVVFGPENEAYRLHTALSVKKHWGEGVERENITLALSFKDEDGKEYPLEGYSYTLTGTATPKDQITENTKSWEEEEWTVGFGLPLTYIDSNGNVKPVFTFTDPDNGKELDPSSTEKETGVARIYELAKANRLTGAKLNANLVITETVNGAEPTQYEFSSEDITLNETSYKEETHTYYDKAKAEVGKVTTKAAVLNFGQNVSNTKPEEEKPEVEKYINNKVHVNLENFDEVFEYSIMGFVPADATEITITDELVPDLRFVDADGNIQGVDAGFDPQNVVVNKSGFHGLVIEGATNNHNANGSGTVTGHNKAWFDNNPGRMLSDMLDKVKVEDNKISITIDKDMMDAHADAKYDKGTTDNDLRGKNIILSYKAVINPESYEKVLKQIAAGEKESADSSLGLKWEKITSNDSSIDVSVDGDGESHSKVFNGKDVESDGSHAGIINKANFKVTINDDGTFNYDTNTVTVKPKTQELEVEKTWAGTDGNKWPEEVSSVTFGLFKTKEGVEKPEPVKGSVDEEGKYTTGTDDAVAVIELTSEKTKVKVTGLPKLEGVTYSAREIKVGDDEVAYNDTNTAGVLKQGDVVKYIVKMIREKLAGSKIDNKFIATNSAPAIEKYVNQKVHAELEAFDTEFTYDIMAYVPAGSTKITISDELKPQLVLKSTKAEIEESVVSKEKNDHKVESSVKQSGTAIKEGVTATIDSKNPNKVDIEVINSDGALDGMWIQATLKAEISSGAYEDVLKQLEKDDPTEANEAINWARITENAPVIDGEKSHSGLVNKASYKIEVGNQSSSVYESNEVTVVPNTVSYAGEKAWTGLEGDETWPKDVTVKFNLVKVSTNEVGETAREIVASVELKKGEETKDFPKQPKLEGVTYEVEEETVAGYMITNEETKTEDGKTTVTITNKPEKPEIEKYINKNVHKFINLEETFTYDIIGYITQDAIEVGFIERLNENLQFKNGGDVKVTVTDLGTDVDHKPNGSVSKKGKDITKAEIEVGVETRSLTVRLDEATSKSVRGHWVRVTFDAELNSDLVEALKNGTKTIDDLNQVEVINGKTLQEDVEKRPAENTGNLPVITDENHKGIPNTSEYIIRTEGDGLYWDKSNTVTVVPEKPEIEKYINQNVHQFIGLDDTFTYDIIAYVTKDADQVEITDTLVNDLEFVSQAGDIVVRDLGETVDHTPYGSVSENGEPVKSSAKIDGKTLTITIGNAEPHRGNWVKATFVAKLDQSVVDAINAGEKQISDLENKEIKKDAVLTEDEGRAETKKGNLPVITEEEHDGVPNTSSYRIKVGNEYKYNDKSNTVTVKPEKPELEKYINKNVHEFVALDEVFTYDIIAYVPNDADKLTITDDLNKQLQFAKAGANVKVFDIGTTNNPKTGDKATEDKVDASVNNSENNITETGDATITATDGKLKVVIANTISNIDNNTGVITYSEEKLSKYRGHYIRVQFDAQLADDVDINNLTTVEITENEPLDVTDDQKDHDGIENKSSYTVKVGNDGKYETESNTVTVTPEEPSIEKYVNNDVHWDMSEFDRLIKYDILVFVPHDADKLQISDTLVNALEFANGKGDAEKPAVASSNKDEVVTSIVAKPENNHKVKGTVSETGGDPLGDKAKVTIDKQNLLIEIDDAKPYHGSYIQVTFWAKYTDKIIEAVKIEDTDTITGNGAVLEGVEEHYGTTNDATYKLFVNNEWSSDYESNTVTVEPKTVVLEVEKKWQDIAGEEMSWPDEVEEVVINIINTKNNNKVVDTIVLNSLETKKSKELPKLVGVEYALEEVSVPGYLTTTEDGKLFVNKKNTILIPVIKTWDDNVDFDGRRTISVVMNLLQDGEIFRSLTITNAAADSANPDVWYGAFTDVPYMDEAGHVYEYTVEEVPVAYYLTEYSGSIDTEFKVTNIHRPWFPEIPETPGEEASFVIKKETTGAAETDKVYNVEISLTFPPEYVAEGEEATYTYTMELKPGEEYTVDKLPAKTQVTIKETSESSKGYEVSYLLNGKDCKTVSFEADTSVVNRVVVINYKAPEKPEKPDKPKEETPKTGDESNMMMWISLAGLAGATTVVMATRRRRNYK